MGVIKCYYGRIKIDGKFTWNRINSLIDEMFTSDYENGELDWKKIHFYGNDGVCLFKYFVDKSDPQKSYFPSTQLSILCCTVYNNLLEQHIIDRFNTNRLNLDSAIH